MAGMAISTDSSAAQSLPCVARAEGNVDCVLVFPRGFGGPTPPWLERGRLVYAPVDNGPRTTGNRSVGERGDRLVPCNHVSMFGQDGGVFDRLLCTHVISKGWRR
jgi:hypothetical protein